jgi:hypothetical protein
LGHETVADLIRKVINEPIAGRPVAAFRRQQMSDFRLSPQYFVARKNRAQVAKNCERGGAEKNVEKRAIF